MKRIRRNMENIRKSIVSKTFYNKLTTLTLILMLALALALPLTLAADIKLQDGSLNISNNLLVNTNTLFVDSANNLVGIGETTPVSKFSLGDEYSNHNNRIALYEQANNFRGLGMVDFGGGRWGVAFWLKPGTQGQPTGASDAAMIIDDNREVGINQTNPLGALHVTDADGDFVFRSGKVGIGTTNPKRKLEVSGSMNATQLNISGPANLAYGSGNVGIGTTNPGWKLEVSGSGVQMGAKYDSNTYVNFYAGDASNSEAIVWKGTLRFWDDLVGERMRIENGKLGIGTSPNATLTIVTGGTTIADEWTVRSDRTLKDEIADYTALNISDAPLQIYTYKLKYKEPIYGVNENNETEIIGYEDKLTKQHLGIMADEAPEELLGEDGKSIDLYAYVSYVYAYAQELKKENELLKARVEVLEKQ